jgi:hypothetical protein
MDDYECKNITEAVALAQSFKSEGRYRYFRGQRDARWGLAASFVRLNAADRHLALDRLKRFYSWIKSCEDLLPYITNDDQILAVAQHYGLATPLIDFTTEPSVAGFFATSGAKLGQLGCIMMIDPVDFSDFMVDVNDAYSINSHFLSVDVTNLWRLQAQKGLFLESKIPLDAIYDPDRILFPHTDQNSPIDPGLIYPKQKSHLELQLDHYFTQERIHKGALESLYDSNGKAKPGFTHIQVEADEPTAAEKEFAASRYGARINRSPPDERWETVVASLVVPPPIISTTDLMFGNPLISWIISERRKMPDLLALDPDEMVGNLSMRNSIALYWNGARLENFSNEQLEAGLLQTVKILRSFAGISINSGKDLRDLANKLYGQAVEIEFSIAGDTYSRAFVAVEMLSAALTQEARKLFQLNDSAPSSSQIRARLALHHRLGSSLFEPNLLADVFARQVIPWQAAYNRPMMIYSSSHLKVLGIP